MKKIIAGIVAVAALVGVMMPVLSGEVYAASEGNVDCPAGSLNSEAKNKALCNVKSDAAGASNLFGTIQTAVNVVLSVLGIVTVLMIVLGGVNYTTSQGDPGKTKKAKDTIVFGIIGLIIAMLAFAIVNFVLTSVFQ